MKEKDLAVKMNLFREKSCINKAQMARDLNIDASTLGNILRGTRGIPSNLIIRFLQVYSEVSAEWFLRDNGDMFTEKNVRQDNVYTNIKNKNIDIKNNDEATLNRFISLLEEKDKQITSLLEIVCNKFK
jgi:plasmid maintenance system antidote protein VapI